MKKKVAKKLTPEEQTAHEAGVKAIQDKYPWTASKTPQAPPKVIKKKARKRPKRTWQKLQDLEGNFGGCFEVLPAKMNGAYLDFRWLRLHINSDGQIVGVQLADDFAWEIADLMQSEEET